MFEPAPLPRLFHVPPGADFPRAVVAGLEDRLSGAPPQAWARVEILVNSARMRRRLTEVLDSGPPRLHPTIRLVTEAALPADLADLPPPVPPLRRRLELAQVVARLLDAQARLAPRATIFDLADSLAALLDEMQGEGVPPEVLGRLDVSDQSGHWQRALQFLNLLQPYARAALTSPDTAALQRLSVERRIVRWRAAPPDHPVLVAGSTGSRGATRMLMRAVAALPQGAVILPGFDTDLPQPVWDGLRDALTGEDHPQFRFATLLADLGLSADQVPAWADLSAPDPARNRVLSLALRPAPVTHQWLTEGPELPDLPAALNRVTMVEARDPRDEAQVIALRLRHAADQGLTAALVTPDRMLTRQVTAALGRWGLRPDDSAGIPAQLTAPGRFLRQVAALDAAPLTAEALTALLKHPLCHAGPGRGDHLRHTRDLELHMRATGWPFPRADALQAWAAGAGCAEWGNWLAGLAFHIRPAGARPLADWVGDHLARAEALTAGCRGGTADPLWARGPGQEAARLMAELRAEAPHGGAMDARDYANLFGAVLARGEVRDTEAAHPRILIWGTLEARVMGADLLILGSLNEGAWPEAPGADPWLNRRLRLEAGLLLPERRIGLSAHDFQQAAGAPEVWLTRALRSEDADTVPSRWINRLTNLLRGLPSRQGPEALVAMRRRGQDWLGDARALERPVPVPQAPRPSPAPPVAARPRQLSVTEIETLKRDPYAIYARRVLRLRPLLPLQRQPDPLSRGTALHGVMEHFVRATLDDPARLDPDDLTRLAEQMLADEVPWPSVLPVWLARIRRIAPWFVAQERGRQAQARPFGFETKGRLDLGQGLVLTAKADRIDLTPEGRARIYDYKTGDPPSPKQQTHFNKQLQLEAAIAENGGFAELGARRVDAATFIGLGSTPAERDAPLEAEPPGVVLDWLRQLWGAYLEPEKGFTARNTAYRDDQPGDYDHLARYGEWDAAEPPRTEVLE